MKKSCVFTVLFALLLAATLTAQQQTSQELPTYTPEQRWERASSQITYSFVLAISYAKSLGQSAEEYGAYAAKLFTPGWGDPGTGSLDIIRGVRRNHLMWSGAEFEIVESSESSVTGRVNRPWAKYFGEDKISYGVTLDELEVVWRTFHRLLAEYKGLKYKDQVKDDWLYMTFSKKE